MWTVSFWKGAAERAVKTFAQAALGMLSADGLGVVDVNWPQVGSVGALAMLISVLTSIVSAGRGPAGSASLVDDRPGSHTPGGV